MKFSCHIYPATSGKVLISSMDAVLYISIALLAIKETPLMSDRVERDESS